MAKKKQTIVEMILTAIGGDIFGKGGERVWYPAIDKETLLAIPTKRALGGGSYLPATRKVLDLLENTTSLSTPLIVEPFFNGLSPATPGLPLAAIRYPNIGANTRPYVLFSKKIKGESFFNLWTQEKLNLDQILSWPPKTFENLMHQARVITEVRLEMDSASRNIMLENGWKTKTPELAIIDLTALDTSGAINDFFKIPKFFSGFWQKKRDKNKRPDLYAKLLDAAEKEGFGSHCYYDDVPDDFPEKYKKRLRAIPPLVVDPDARKFPPELTAIGTLPLTASVSDLKGFLKDIENAKCGRNIT
jgi:hypothetical protein